MGLVRTNITLDGREGDAPARSACAEHSWQQVIKVSSRMELEVLSCYWQVVPSHVYLVEPPSAVTMCQDLPLTAIDL